MREHVGEPVKVFISYSHRDEGLRRKLESHLSTLRREGLVSDWSDRKIVSGQDWAHEIDTHLNEARLILLLVSPDFNNSEYCAGIEAQRALERRKNGDAIVVPIMLRPGDLGTLEYLRFQALPEGLKPITKWRNRDEGWLNVACGIRKVIRESMLPVNKSVELSARTRVRRLLSNIYLSYPEDDFKYAEKIRSLLSRGTFAFGSRDPILIPGENEERNKNLASCDYLVVPLTQHTRKSKRVAIDVGAALKLQCSRRTKQPQVIGVLCDPAASDVSIDLRDGSGQKTGVRYDFAAAKRLDLCNDLDSSQTQLMIDFLTPTVTFIDGSTEDDFQLLKNSRGCYERLFPDESERDDISDIATWIEEANKTKAAGSPWHEFFGVLRAGKDVAGLIYLSAHKDRDWCFGNYFGILADWRQTGRAEQFLEASREELLARLPDLAGILFEIEGVEFNLLEKKASANESMSPRNWKPVVSQLRALKRLILYQTNHATAVVRSDGKPLSYLQPALRPPLKPHNERSLILMMYPLKESSGDLDLLSILDFLYDDLYGSAYEDSSTTGIKGYRDYLRDVKRRVYEGAEIGCRLGTIPIPPRLRRLFYQLKCEGYAEALEL